MRITQGTFSYLPDLNTDEVRAQVQYAIDQGWAVAVEHTDDPHPRNFLWDMWGLPMFDVSDAAAAMLEIAECIRSFPDSYVRVSAYDARLSRQTTALSFLVHRPAVEPGFTMVRQEVSDRQIRYTLHARSGPPGGDGGGRQT